MTALEMQAKYENLLDESIKDKGEIIRLREVQANIVKALMQFNEAMMIALVRKS